jgi:hypothetical protein
MYEKLLPYCQALFGYIRTNNLSILGMTITTCSFFNYIIYVSYSRIEREFSLWLDDRKKIAIILCFDRGIDKNYFSGSVKIVPTADMLSLEKLSIWLKRTEKWGDRLSYVFRYWEHVWEKDKIFKKNSMFLIKTK